MPRHINIPIFIPHEGCKNSCVFCDQRSITGTKGSASRDIRPEIDKALTTISQKDFVEIAFFGGSFTGIDTELMTRLCDTAFEYVKSGKVNAIRLSTRPDYINEHILDILRERGVTDIELGIQSMSERVLQASKRGHSPKQTELACTLIKKYGFNLVGQMMIGLPCSDISDEIKTAKEIVSLSADGARIYPTVVFKDTELYRMSLSGKYVPLTLDQAVERSTEVYSIFKDAGIPVLRIGLHSSAELSDASKVYAGANHPALGELVMGEYFYRKLLGKIPEILELTECVRLINRRIVICIYCHKSNVSKISGQNGKNKKRLLEILKDKCPSITDIKILPNSVFSDDKMKISVQNI